MNMILKELKSKLNGLSIEDQLESLSLSFPGKIIFTTSLGIEDQVITHLIFKNNFNIKVALSTQADCFLRHMMFFPTQ
jgi:phosphoadenosine phosphosulfate reductase